MKHRFQVPPKFGGFKLLSIGRQRGQFYAAGATVWKAYRGLLNDDETASFYPGCAVSCLLADYAMLLTGLLYLCSMVLGCYFTAGGSYNA